MKKFTKKAISFILSMIILLSFSTIARHTTNSYVYDFSGAKAA